MSSNHKAVYTLYAPESSFRAFATLISAEFNEIDIHTSTNTSTDVLDMSPTGKLPILVISRGDNQKKVIFNSHSIARYVASMRQDTGLLGNNYEESAMVDFWVDFALQELELPSCLCFYPVAGYMPYSEEHYKRGKDDLSKQLEVLNEHLKKGGKNKKFLVSNNITLADIVVVCTLLYPFKLACDKKYLKPFGNVMGWFNRCINAPEFQQVLGKVTTCKNDPFDGTTNSGDNNNSNNNKKNKKEKNKKQKETKKDDGGKKQEENVPTDAAAATPPAAAPVVVLSAPADPSNDKGVDMAAWKSTYTAASNKAAVMDEFWSNYYNQDTTSVWKCVYDEPDSNEDLESTIEIVTEFMKNTQPVRDDCFGVMHVFGELEIEGLWFFNGPDPEILFGANEDTSWFSWSQLGPLASDPVKSIVATLFAPTDNKLNGKLIKDTNAYVEGAATATTTAPVAAAAAAAVSSSELVVGDAYIIPTWKAMYAGSHKDAKVMDTFWSSIYDQETLSIWRCVYDEPDDNKDLPSTVAIVTEFMKKTEKVKDTSFGVMHVIGDYEIEGLWLFKGPDPEELFGANEDTSWFTWSQLGPVPSAAVKSIVAALWAPESKELNGKAIMETKVYTAPFWCDGCSS